MRYCLVLLIFVAAVCVAGCSKKHDDSVIDTPAYQPPFGKLVSSVAVYKEGDLLNTTWYLYNSKNRPVLSYNTDKDSTIYTYTDTQLVVTSVYHGSSRSSYTYNIGRNGLATSYTNGSGSGTYTYDSGGYLLSVVSFFPSHTHDTSRYTYVGGNRTFWGSYTSYSINTQSLYEFNALHNSIGDANMGITWKGKSNTNLTSQLVYVYSMGTSNDTTLTQYSYELNADSTVNKCNYTQTNGGVVTHYRAEYTYR